MSRRVTTSVVALAVVVLAVCPRPLFANSFGIVGYSGIAGFICTACHGGGTVPTVAFAGPRTLDSGATGTFTFTVNSNAPASQVATGLDVAVSGGTLIAGESDEQVLGDELTHTQPKANDSEGRAVWTFQWQAPPAPGTYTFFGAGNSVNLNTQNSGDNAAGTTLRVQVPGPSGDANCDGRATAADLPGVLLAIGQSVGASCPAADTNGDGRINADDIAGAIAAIFAQ